MTTVRTSSENAYNAWKEAQREAAAAGEAYRLNPTKETKQAWKAANDKQDRLMKAYSDSRIAKFQSVLPQFQKVKQ